MVKQNKNFFLKGDVDFNDRQKSVFGMLDDLTPQNNQERYSEDELQMEQSKKTVSKCKKELDQFRGRESIFKKPERPSTRSFKMKIPDFVKNPQKWKRYKMGDDVMTEKSNTAAAYSFLREMKDRSDSTGEETVSAPILFNKHAVKDDGESLAEKVESTSTFRSSKTVMPEYVVGQKPKKKVTFKKQTETETNPTTKPSQSIKLQHLFDEDD